MCRNLNHLELFGGASLSAHDDDRYAYEESRDDVGLQDRRKCSKRDSRLPLTCLFLAQILVPQRITIRICEESVEEVTATPRGRHLFWVSKQDASDTRSVCVGGSILSPYREVVGNSGTEKVNTALLSKNISDSKP